MSANLRRMFPTPESAEEETVTILDTFGRAWEVTPAEYRRFTTPPPILERA